MERVILGLLPLLLIFGCIKETPDPRSYPRIRTLPVTNITEEGATFNATLISVTNEPIIENGFVWDTLENPSLNSEHITITEVIESDHFNAIIKSTLLPGENYYVKAFTRTNTHIVFGDEISFISEGSYGPTISDFHPKKATPGDTIIISGSSFSNLIKSNIVKFELIQAEVIDTNDKIIKTIVPKGMLNQKSYISVSVGDKTSVTLEKFELAAPKILDFFPKLGTLGDTVTIFGKSFISNVDQIQVKFNSIQAPIINASSDYLNVLVPLELNKPQSKVSVKIGKDISVSDSSFHLTKPTLLSLSPDFSKINDTIRLTGENFSLFPEANNVYFGNYKSSVLKSTKSKLTIVVPKHDGYTGMIRKVPPVIVSLSIGGIVSYKNLEFNYLSPVITSMSPTTVAIGDTLTIFGKKILPFYDEWYIETNFVESRIIEILNDKITIIIPSGISMEYSNIRFYTNYYYRSYWNYLSFEE
ncbi:IPT/TIG domain-containing protein [Bacteroidota bacterium]